METIEVETSRAADYEDDTTTSSTPCAARLCWELRTAPGLFSLQEPNGRTLDMEACFLVGRDGKSREVFGWLLLRLWMMLWSWQVLAYDLYWYPPHNLYIYMGYLTHWGHLLSIGYLTASFFLSVRSTLVVRRQAASTKHDSSTGTTAFQTTPTPTKTTRLIYTIWGLYSLAAPLELSICLLYWAAVAGTGPSAFSYVSVCEHGGIALAVLLDGVTRGIPVRVPQVAYLLGLCGLYLVWTVVDAVLGIGNGEWGPAYDDDALYPILNWNSNRETAMTASAVAICLVAPGSFFVCWLLGLVAWRKQTTDDDDTNVAKKKNGSGCCGCGGCGGLIFDGSQRPLLPLRQDAAGDADAAANYKVMGDDAPQIV